MPSGPPPPRSTAAPPRDRPPRRARSAGGTGSRRACGRVGHHPWIASSHSRRGSVMRGMERRGPGCRVRRPGDTVRTSDRSTTLPRYITTRLIGHLGDDPQIVGDVHDRHPIVLRAAHEVRIWACVVTSRAVVGSSAIRRLGWGEGHGDHRALAHPAGELKGVGIERLRGFGHPDARQDVGRALAGFGARGALVQADRLDDLVADGVDGGEGDHRLLKDHGDLVAADGADLPPAGVEAGQVDDLGRRRGAVRAGVAVVEQFPLDDAPRRRHDPQDRLGRDRLATATLADDGQRLAPVDRKLRPVHGADDALVEVKVGLEPLDLDQQIVLNHRGSHPLPALPGGRPCSRCASMDRRHRAGRRR